MIMYLSFCKQIHQLLERYGGQKPDEKEGEYNFVNESGLDSFELLNFITDVEDFFGVQFSPEELSHTDSQTVEGLSRLIASKKGKSV